MIITSTSEHCTVVGKSEAVYCSVVTVQCGYRMVLLENPTFDLAIMTQSYTYVFRPKNGFVNELAEIELHVMDDFFEGHYIVFSVC